MAGMAHRPTSSDHDRQSRLSDRSHETRLSNYSDESHASYSTNATESDLGSPKYGSRWTEKACREDGRRLVHYEDQIRSTSSSLASTVPSLSENQASEEGLADFDIPVFQPHPCNDDSVTSTPMDFGMLFPSTRRLMVAHDETAADGNMNLKVNTQVHTRRGSFQTMTLFHLRMYDLKAREFSLRRYDRDSGREVCKSSRSSKQTQHRAYGLQQSLTDAVASMRVKADARMHSNGRSGQAQSRNLTMNASDARPHARPQSAGHDVRTDPQLPNDMTRLTFTNYSSVEIKGKGTQSSRHYKFSFWGDKYHWKRHVRLNESEVMASFHLYQVGRGGPLANIVPVPLSSRDRVDERARGGWVPPCAMWISDERLIHAQNGLSDVIIASGLIALVDDCIKRRFPDETSRDGHGAFDIPKLKPLSKVMSKVRACD